MANNSIRSNLSKEDIISDIVLSIGADITKQNVYVIVEGEDDISLLCPYLMDNVLIYESYDGKNGVEVIVSRYFYDRDNVIGIRDRDYQIQPISEKIFYYDCGCMEMMLIANNDVFDNLCFEYYRGNVKSGKLREYLLRQLGFLSVIRMFNERKNWSIKLNGISISQAWNPDKYELDNDILINKINQINNNFINETVLSDLQSENTKEWTSEQYLLYTRGHDFFMLFSTVCNQHKKRGVKYADIESSARCIFRWSDLIKTKLYREIVKYSESRHMSILHVSV